MLEVGCGAGWMWAEAAARLPGDLDLTLTDVSPGMVDEAVERVGSLGRYLRTTGRVADVQDLPFRDAVVRRRRRQLRAAPRARPRPGRRRDGPRAAARRHARRGLRRRRPPHRAPPDPPRGVRRPGGRHLRLVVRRHRRGRGAARRGSARCGGSRTATTSTVATPTTSSTTWRRRPPVEGASDDRARTRRATVQQRFAAGGGRLRVSKDTGAVRLPPPPRRLTPSSVTPAPAGSAGERARAAPQRHRPRSYPCSLRPASARRAWHQRSPSSARAVRPLAPARAGLEDLAEVDLRLPRVLVRHAGAADGAPGRRENCRPP